MLTAKHLAFSAMLSSRLPREQTSTSATPAFPGIRPMPLAMKAAFCSWRQTMVLIFESTSVSNKVQQQREVKIGDEESDSEPSSMAKEVPDWRPNPEELYSQYQLRQRLRQALEQLPGLYSTVFLLRDMQGLSVTETAAALRLSIPTVKTRLLRARLQLREILSKSFIRTWTEADHARSNLVARGR